MIKANVPLLLLFSACMMLQSFEDSVWSYFFNVNFKKDSVEKVLMVLKQNADSAFEKKKGRSFNYNLAMETDEDVSVTSYGFKFTKSPIGAPITEGYIMVDVGTTKSDKAILDVKWNFFFSTGKQAQEFFDKTVAVFTPLSAHHKISMDDDGIDKYAQFNALDKKGAIRDVTFVYTQKKNDRNGMFEIMLMLSSEFAK